MPDVHNVLRKERSHQDQVAVLSTIAQAVSLAHTASLEAFHGRRAIA